MHENMWWRLWVTGVVILAVNMLVLTSLEVLNLHRRTQRDSGHILIWVSQNHRDVRKMQIGERGSVDDLIRAIVAATRNANGGLDPVFSDEELRAWEIENSCRSRAELDFMYSRRKYVRDVHINENWNTVLREYAKLHRTCMQKIGSARNYFMSRNTTTGCKFAVADTSIGGGLGNKMLSISNTLLYAILTQRVILIRDATLIPAIMCQPFPGTSWLLSTDFPIPPWEDANAHLWAKHSAVYKKLDQAEGYPDSENLYASHMDIYQYQPDSRFFCDTEQEHFSGVTWLYFTGCLYTIPKFFAIPYFRHTLEALFPDRMVLTHMLRTLMLPTDSVWERVQGVDAEYLKSADRRVGVQVRYREKMQQYHRMNDVVNQRIMQCLQENQILPVTIDSEDGNGSTSDSQIAFPGSNSSAPLVLVFITSLHLGFLDHFTKNYQSHSTSTGEKLRGVQLTNDSFQDYGLEIDIQGLTEILTLSFSDELLVTPQSTFGGIAQAYGALTPWIIEVRSPNRQDLTAPCERAKSVDLCYQEADPIYDCRYDETLHKKPISEIVPYIENCLTIDAEAVMGVQLITTATTMTEEAKTRPRKTKVDVLESEV